MTKKRTHNPNWPDTPEARRERQAKRRARLTEIAQAIGYDTWYKLETGILHGEATVTKTDRNTDTAA